MTRLGIAMMMVVIAACSDDGVPSTGSDTIEADTNVTSNEGGSETGGTGSSASSTATSASTLGDTSGGTGGSSSEGPAGSSDATSSADTGPLPPSACMTDDDCLLVEDCCTCGAIAVGEEAPMCDQPECEQSACGAAGLQDPSVRCQLGFCELVGVDCNGAAITCDQAPPKCDEGFLPSVTNGCWTGFCVPAQTCEAVGSCDDCPQDQTCVEMQAFMTTYTCSPIPESCNGTPTCACMGEVCEDPFTACNEIEGSIVCGCPTC